MDLGLSAAVERKVLGWPAVATERNRFFGDDVTLDKVGRRQLGHVHHDGAPDLPFPKAVHDEPIAAGRAGPHGAGFAGAVGVARDRPEDVPKLVALVRLGDDRATAAGGGRRLADAG